MRSATYLLSILTALTLPAETAKNQPPTAATAVHKATHWLVSTQGKDGGWGQDGGETSYVRQSDRQETTGNDVANTAVAALALWKTGNPAYRPSLDRAVDFILRHIEASPADGLAITNITGSQIQRKLGPFIDTFLAAQLLGELDGRLPQGAQSARVRAALVKCVRKIEANQAKDGSWNQGGGWAPILSTSMASRGLQLAKSKGVPVDEAKLARVDNYTAVVAAAPAVTVAGSGRTRGATSAAAAEASAGVALYSRAQQLEQLSRDAESRKRNAPALRQIVNDLKDENVMRGFGSMGGEEFFSYLNISDSLKRQGGKEWDDWNRSMKSRLVSLQNNDGTWAGHHCITGRVAVTSAAVLTLLVEKAS